MRGVCATVASSLAHSTVVTEKKKCFSPFCHRWKENFRFLISVHVPRKKVFWSKRRKKNHQMITSKWKVNWPEENGCSGFILAMAFFSSLPTKKRQKPGKRINNEEKNIVLSQRTNYDWACFFLCSKPLCVMRRRASKCMMRWEPVDQPMECSIIKILFKSKAKSQKLKLENPISSPNFDPKLNTNLCIRVCVSECVIYLKGTRLLSVHPWEHQLKTFSTHNGRQPCRYLCAVLCTFCENIISKIEQNLFQIRNLFVCWSNFSFSSSF